MSSELENFDTEDLGVIFELLSTSSLADVLDRDRPYDGQEHTYLGARGSQLV